MVIAASFSQTYLRNAFNNAFICSRARRCTRRCARRPSIAWPPARRRSWRRAGDRRAALGRDLRRREYAIGPLGPAAQELIMAGGLEALTRARLGAT